MSELFAGFQLAAWILHVLPDLINACLELGGGVVVCLSIREVLKHRLAVGIHWAQVLFFAAWGLWNPSYYSGLGQSLSSYASMFVACANVAYLVLVVRFRKRKDNNTCDKPYDQSDRSQADCLAKAKEAVSSTAVERTCEFCLMHIAPRELHYGVYDPVRLRPAFAHGECLAKAGH